jgi:Glycosyl transferase family 2
MFPRLLESQRWLRRVSSSVRMRRVTSDGGVAAGPALFAVVRNEMLRLPRFLAYYRERGIDRFFIVENNSTDGTASYLAEQKDVCLYQTRESFVKKEAWLDILLRRHGSGQWCLVVDADELLDYPDSNRLDIPDICDYLQSRSENALHAVLLDLYPGTSLEEVEYEPGTDYFKWVWYFDPPEDMNKVPRAFYKGSGLNYRFEGGLRKRVFGLGSCCSKFPLFRFRSGMFLRDGQHYLEGARISALRGVLYHFKYLQDFAPRVWEEVDRAQHWKGAQEYKAYARELTENKGATRFLNERSIRFEDVEQIESLRVVVRPPDFDSYFENLGATSDRSDR